MALLLLVAGVCFLNGAVRFCVCMFCVFLLFCWLSFGGCFLFVRSFLVGFFVCVFGFGESSFP